MAFNLAEITPENISSNICALLGTLIGIEWDQVSFKPEDLKEGMLVEYEHGSKDPMTNITNNDPIMTAKIALAHLNEHSDYYKILNSVKL